MDHDDTMDAMDAMDTMEKPEDWPIDKLLYMMKVIMHENKELQQHILSLKFQLVQTQAKVQELERSTRLRELNENNSQKRKLEQQREDSHVEDGGFTDTIASIANFQLDSFTHSTLTVDQFIASMGITIRSDIDNFKSLFLKHWLFQWQRSSRNPAASITPFFRCLSLFFRKFNVPLKPATLLHRLGIVASNDFTDRLFNRLTPISNFPLPYNFDDNTQIIASMKVLLSEGLTIKYLLFCMDD